MTDRSREKPGVDPRRSELLTHCYRLLGSLREAEQLTDRALAAPGDPYLEATRLCLTRADAHRPLPSAIGEPNDHPEGKLTQRPEVTWLEPLPDKLSGAPVGLELVAALQRLPMRQRAAFVLHDFDQRPAAEVAAVLDTTPGDLQNLLTEARDAYRPGRAHQPAENESELLARYARAFEQYDVPAIVTFFADDAVWEMPPFTSWFRGAKAIGRLIATHCPAEGPGDQVLVPIRANGRPGFAVYLHDPVANVHRAFQLQVLTLTVTGIIHAVAFFDVTLFEAFDLPELLTGLPEDNVDRQRRVRVDRRRH